MLVLIISPMALFGAALRTLHKMNGDSELVVMSASGMSPGHLMRPALILSGLVAAAVLALSLVIAPLSMRELTDTLAKVQASLLASVVRPGQFTTIEKDLTFHIRDRGPGGRGLLGIVVSDKRNPVLELTYFADHGQITQSEDKTLLVLDQGSIQRRETATGQTSVVNFERYGFDVGHLVRPVETVYKPMERSTWELLFPRSADLVSTQAPGRLRQELHDRIAAPLYPIALICIAYAVVGNAATTRQGRRGLMLGSIALMMTVRGLGFAVSSFAADNPWASFAIYLLPLATIVIAGSYGAGFWQKDDVTPLNIREVAA